MSEFLKQLEQANNGASGELKQLLKEKQEIELQIERLTAAIAEGVPARTLKEAFSQRERELRVRAQAFFNKNYAFGF